MNTQLLIVLQDLLLPWSFFAELQSQNTKNKLQSVPMSSVQLSFVLIQVCGHRLLIGPS